MQWVLIVIGVVLIGVGLYFAVVGHGHHGDSEAGARGIVIKGPPWLMLVAIGVGLVVFGSVWRADSVPDVGGGLASGGADVVADIAPGAPEAEQPVTKQPETEQPVSGSGCRVTIGNPLVSLLEEPDTFAQEIVSVPSGEYLVSTIEQVSFGGIKDQRWLKIEVSGREGWIEDSTFNIAAKSADCP